jgi:myo-inositol 2-dehydrogenase / D-chiro-inositol 1-dehydrogenase
MRSSQLFTRRNFLKGSLAALATIQFAPRHILSRSGKTSPSEVLTRAVIGVGGIGRTHITSLNTKAKLLAVCDVDERHLQEGLRLGGPEVKGYKDFRELLQRKDIDIVHIATPPHWHALMATAAAAAGKDIWCEKPMTRTISEGEAVMAAVARHERIFRLNTWFRFEGPFYGMGCTVKPLKRAVENGLLGWPIKATLNAYTGFDWKFRWVGRTDLTAQPVPPELDYNLWLGPAPYKPYHPHRVHSTFRGYWDYDGGGLGDMGQHYLDPVQYILGKDDQSPVEIEADAPPQHPDAVGTWRRIRMRYADGCEIVLDGENKERSAAFLAGPYGRIFRDFESDIPDFERKLAQLPPPEPQLTDFATAVRTRRKFALNEINGHRSCTLVNLAKIAVQTGRLLRFDPETQRFSGDEKADAYVSQRVRGSWKV